jgi:uncharacterized membrane protein YgcG
MNTLTHYFKLIICYISLLLFAASSQADNVISIGHSLLGHPTMPDAVEAFTNEVGINHSSKTQNIPGSSLQNNFQNPGQTHVDNYQTELANSNFDIFIITEAMALDAQVEWSNSYQYALSFYDYAINDNPNTRFYIFQSWDCRSVDGNCDAGRLTRSFTDQINYDRPLWEGMADSIMGARSGADVKIIPGGQAMLALNTAIEAGQVPSISNIGQVFADSIHLNDAGWYFMALVKYATMYQRDPTGLTNVVNNEWGQAYNMPSAATAAAMQQIAWQTVCNYSRSGVSCDGSTPAPVDPPPPVVISPPSPPSGLSVALVVNESGDTGSDSGSSDTSGGSGGSGSTDGSGDNGGSDTGTGNNDGSDNSGDNTGSDSGNNNVAALPGCAADRAAGKASTGANPYSYSGSVAMGSNLATFAYWESSYPFIDLRRQGDHDNRGLGSWNNSGSGGQIDSNGNVITLSSGTVSKGLVLDANCVYSGDYVVLWDETASPAVSLTHYGAGSLTLTTEDAANGRRVYTLTLPEGLSVRDYKGINIGVEISAPITSNTDFHVLLPGTEELYNNGGLFNPDFVEDLADNNVLRFMDWLATNDSTIVNASDLPNMDWDSWAYDKGIPYSVTMKLTKQAGVPIAWINVPHLATQATMEEIARQVYAEWEPGITVYIEFSNEVWNSGFQQTQYAASQGAIEIPPLNGMNAEGTWLAKKSIEMKQVFTTVFGGNASAIKLVVAGHIEQTSDWSEGDNCYHNCRLANNYNNIAAQVDVYAVAPYFAGELQGPDYANANNVANWSDSQMFNYLQSGGLNTNLADIATDLVDVKAMMASVTGRSNIDLTLYEFGQHLSAFHAPDSALNARYAAFQQTTEMGQLYQELVQSFIDAGVTVAAQFDLHSEHSVGFYWGAREGIAGPTLPRTHAIEAAY